MITQEITTKYIKAIWMPLFAFARGGNVSDHGLANVIFVMN